MARTYNSERLELGAARREQPGRVREVVVVHEGPVPHVAREVLPEAELAAAEVLPLPVRPRRRRDPDRAAS